MIEKQALMKAAQAAYEQRIREVFGCEAGERSARLNERTIAWSELSTTELESEMRIARAALASTI